ncbi:MAG: type II toxin-antitoxin system VapC family toxin [Candidatus Omnitrophica bacterium]|nr:type II toxin-antitoxin system VapC family toxin [Candidatus Omnitrophota bacterium]
MKKFVIDDSVVMSWCFEDEQSAHSQRILQNLNTAVALTPALWPFEIANGLLMAERRKRISLEDVVIFLGFLKQLPIQTDRFSIKEAGWLACYHLAREHHLTVYDASYLHLAAREKIPLATFDSPMIKAAHDLKIDIL